MRKSENNDFNPETTILDVAWSNNYPRYQSERIQSYLKDKPEFILLARFIQIGLENRLNPFEIAEISSRNNRFGEYGKTIRQMLENEMDKRELAKLSNETRIDIEKLEAQSAFLSLILDKAGTIYIENKQTIPTELQLDREKGSTNMQFIAELFSLICVGYKKPTLFGRVKSFLTK